MMCSLPSGAISSATLKQAIKSGQDRTQTQAESDKWTSAASLAGASTSTGGLVWPAVFPCVIRVTDVGALVYCEFSTTALHIRLSTIDLVLSAHPAKATTILSTPRIRARVFPHPHHLG